MTSHRYSELDGRSSAPSPLSVHVEELYVDLPNDDLGIVEQRRVGRTRIVIEGDDRHVDWLTEGMMTRLEQARRGFGPDPATPATPA